MPPSVPKITDGICIACGPIAALLGAMALVVLKTSVGVATDTGAIMDSLGGIACAGLGATISGAAAMVACERRKIVPAIAMSAMPVVSSVVALRYVLGAASLDALTALGRTWPLAVLWAIGLCFHWGRMLARSLPVRYRPVAPIMIAGVFAAGLYLFYLPAERFLGSWYG